MTKFKCLLISVLIIFISTTLPGEKKKIPVTPAGKLLVQFLDVMETGKIKEFITSHMSQKFSDKVPEERQLRFLKMLYKSHGGFEVFKIFHSTANDIRVVALGKNSKAWRKIIIHSDPSRPDKVIGMDIDMASAPEEYLATLPKIKIERPADDDSIVDGDLAKKIDRYMTKMESIGYSGALGIAKNGVVILAKGYGYADRKKNKIFQRNTVFTIGSIAKQFTGAALVKLESMGKISFNDKLSRFFQFVPEDKKDITIHQLLTHTAGFPPAVGDDLDKITRVDFVKLAFKSKLKNNPGEIYDYSNVGFSLAGIILEIVTGESYESFLHKHILQPAGVSFTGYILPEWDPENIVVGYRGETIWGKPTELMWGKDGPGWHLKCNGGILSTIDDMLTWGEALQGSKVFTPEEKKAYLTPYVPEGPEGDSYYAYGWVRMKSSRGTEVITHNGGNPYIQNDMFIYPEEKIVMFITSNNGQFSAIDQSGKILKMIFE